MRRDILAAVSAMSDSELASFEREVGQIRTIRHQVRAESLRDYQLDRATRGVHARWLARESRTAAEVLAHSYVAAGFSIHEAERLIRQL